MSKVVRFILLSSLLVTAFLAVQAIAEESEVSPYTGPVGNPPATDPMWDILFQIDATAECGNSQCLGVEFADNKFFATGRRDGGFSKMYIMDITGTIIDSVDTPTTTTWGCRDIAYDGTYLYTGDESPNIFCFDTDGNRVPAMDIPRPSVTSTARALAYDPMTDHFFISNWGPSYYEIDRAGTVVGTYSAADATSQYGFAFDDDGYLWAHCQMPSTSYPKCTLVKLEARTGMALESQAIPVPLSSTSAIAGGLAWTTEYNTTATAVMMAQGTPDVIYVIDLVDQPGQVSIDLTYQSGSPVPAGGGNLTFDVFVENYGSVAVDYDAWLYSSYQGGDPTTLVLRSFTNYQPGWTINRPGMYYPVPSSWASGSYVFGGAVGSNPAGIWDSSEFPFTKSGTDYVEGFVPIPVAGAPNPFDEIIKSDVIQPTEYMISGAYPNPFNPTTSISYTLPEASKVSLVVYDIHGRQVAELVNGHREIGTHDVTFDASNLASGVYFYSLSAGEFNTVGKMVLMK